MQKKQKFFKRLLIITGFFACFFTFNSEKIFAQTITDGYTYHGTNGNPADNSRWYIGNGLSSTSNLCYNKISSTGILNQLSFYVTYSGAATSEASTIYLLKNNATSTITDFVFTGGNGAGYSTTTLNVNVTKGDTICLATQHPTWVTNPTGVTYYVNFGIDTEIESASSTSGTTTTIITTTPIQGVFYGLVIWVMVFGLIVFLTIKLI